MRISITLSLLFFTIPAFSQLAVDDQIKPQSKRQVHRLITKRGDSLLGTVMDWDSRTVSFRIKGANEIDLPISAVDTILLIPMFTSKWPRKDPNLEGRLLLSPTAFSLKQGEWEYNNLLILGNSLHHGFSDNLTVGLGGFFIGDVVVSWVNFKQSFTINQRFRVATGGLMVNGIDFNEDNVIPERHSTHYRNWHGFIAFTIGNKDAYLNLCLFKGMRGDDAKTEFSPWMSTFGGSVRISQVVRLFAEIGTLELEEGLGLSNIGISFLGKKSNAKFGFMLNEEFRGFPVFSYSRMVFTKKKKLVKSIDI